MSENEAKSVTVTLTEADLKAGPGLTRKRRARKGGAEPPTPAPAVTQETPLPTPPQIPTPPQVPQSSQLPTPPQVSQVPQPSQLPTPPTPPTPSGGVRIKTRKRGAMPPVPIPSKSARILPIKRHALPSKEKPKLVIPTAKPAAAVATTTATATAIVRKRRFTERRIGISLKSIKKNRKATRRIRKQVAGMSIPDIKTILTEKGILKGGKQPDTMLRSMMADYLSLKQ